MIYYEVYRRRGKGWQYLGTKQARSMRSACLQMGYIHNCKYLAARPEGSRDRLYVFRFLYVPSLTSG